MFNVFAPSIPDRVVKIAVVGQIVNVGNNKKISANSLSKFEDTSEQFFSESVAWRDVIVEIEVKKGKEKVHLITAGRRDKSGSYFDKVTSLDWASFYQHKGGFLIESLRNEWKAEYDYILIDSRTGITDIGGICTIQLPDILVLLFTATEQSLNGVVDVAAKAQAAQWDLPFDRTSLTCLPIPSRFDSNEEFTISRQWLRRFAKELKNIYDDWLPVSVERKNFLEVTKIPYSSYFSFGEKLPVLEQGTTDPTGLGYAYENLATIIADEFESIDKLLENRDKFVAKQSQPKSRIKIFISYSSTDRVQVREMYDRLQEEGYQVWTPDFNVLPGQNFSQEINSAISSSDIFLACLSENSIRSEFVKAEWRIAADSYHKYSGDSIYFIPIQLGSLDFSSLDLGEMNVAFQELAWLDLREENGFSRLFQAVESVRTKKSKAS